jgi:hypothetical protein
MKILFVGPSLPDAGSLAQGDGIIVAGPALQGDVAMAAKSGAFFIGIVDGGFEYSAPVWHKEILYALSQGVSVFGAASMGALRAAECKAFGMVGVGRIFRDYDSGAVVDDADVALVHAPAELGYQSLSLALVNVRATLDMLEQDNRLAGDDRRLLEQAAGDIFFKDRTWRSVVEKSNVSSELHRLALLSLLTSNAVDQKRLDALELLEVMRSADKGPVANTREWQFNETFPI